MGAFGADTKLLPLGDGRYRATLRRDWEIWGPMGGYVAAIALRAAGAEAGHQRPASFFCHYLAPARFDEIELAVEPIRRGRAAESLRVHVTQGERGIMDATVSVVSADEGLVHDDTAAPSVPAPDDLPDLWSIWEAQGIERPAMTFWDNFDPRPVDGESTPTEAEPLRPVWRQWHRFVPDSTFDDPWLDAARYLLLTDLPSWPAAMKHHRWRWAPNQMPDWYAPGLDLYVAFHQSAMDDPWLLVDGHAPLASNGLLAWTCRVWSSTGLLLSSGGGQSLFRRTAGSPIGDR